MNPAKMMKIRVYLSATVLVVLIFVSPTALADLIVLKNGKTIKVDNAWRLDNEIWFILGDIKASLPHSKVARIETVNNNPGQSSGDTAHQKTAANKAALPQPLTQMVPNQSSEATKAVLTTPSAAGSSRKPHYLRPDGFSDLKWGARLSGINGLEMRQTDSGLKDVIEYLRPSDSRRLGQAALKSIVYAFWRDRLYTVTVWTQGRANYIALQGAVFDQYGPGTRPDPSIEKYLWSDGASDMMLKYTKDDQYGFLWMRSKIVDRKFKLSKLNGHTTYIKSMKPKK